MEVYLIRHTTPQIAKGICYGQSDVPLADSFNAEIAVLLKQLPPIFDAVFSSPLTRCYQVAKHIQAKKITVDKRLLELNFGDWEMKNWDDIDQKALNTWMKAFVQSSIPGGESYLDLTKRVQDFITSVTRSDYKRVAIVTHGGVIRSFLAYALDTPLKDTFSYALNFGSIVKISIRKDNHYIVNFINKQ